MIIFIFVFTLLNLINMKELFEFLNHQSGERLVGYGIIFLVFTFYIMQGLVCIFEAIFKNKK